MTKPNTLILSGSSGVGKSTLALRMSAQMQGRMSLLTPSRFSDEFAPVVDWSAIDCVAVDDLRGWDAKSLASGFAALLEQANRLDKKILLIVQDQAELAYVGITLPDEPAVLLLQGRAERAVFSYQGRELSYPD